MRASFVGGEGVNFDDDGDPICLGGWNSADTDRDKQKAMARDVTPDKEWPLYYSLRCPIRKKYNPCGLEWYNTETKIDCMEILAGNFKGWDCFVCCGN